MSRICIYKDILLHHREEGRGGEGRGGEGRGGEGRGGEERRGEEGRGGEGRGSQPKECCLGVFLLFGSSARVSNVREVSHCFSHP